MRCRYVVETRDGGREWCVDFLRCYQTSAVWTGSNVARLDFAFKPLNFIRYLAGKS